MINTVGMGQQAAGRNSWLFPPHFGTYLESCQ